MSDEDFEIESSVMSEYPVRRHVRHYGKKEGTLLGLTVNQQAIVEALCRLGRVSYVAAEMGKNTQTVGQTLYQACKRTGHGNTILLLLAYHDAKRERERQKANPWAPLMARH